MTLRVSPKKCYSVQQGGRWPWTLQINTVVVDRRVICSFPQQIDFFQSSLTKSFRRINLTSSLAQKWQRGGCGQVFSAIGMKLVSGCDLFFGTKFFDMGGGDWLLEVKLMRGCGIGCSVWHNIVSQAAVIWFVQLFVVMWVRSFVWGPNLLTWVIGSQREWVLIGCSPSSRWCESAIRFWHGVWWVVLDRGCGPLFGQKWVMWDVQSVVISCDARTIGCNCIVGVVDVGAIGHIFVMGDAFGGLVGWFWQETATGSSVKLFNKVVWSVVQCDVVYTDRLIRTQDVAAKMTGSGLN